MSAAYAVIAREVVRRFARASRQGVRVIAVTGSVAVGKSCFAHGLRRALSRQLREPIELVSTDGFLRSDDELLQAGLLERKGFPESHDHAALDRFCTALQSGEPRVTVPVYSHRRRGVSARRQLEVGRWLIVEGVYALQPLRASGLPCVSIFLEADRDAIETWYVARSLRLRSEPGAPISALERRAKQTFAEVNAVNYDLNVAPLAAGADLVLRKSASHAFALPDLRSAFRSSGQTHER
jgi:type I pantothenate kinase